jgi:pimeloyl-ACP methyl ester carboxylesterase
MPPENTNPLLMPGGEILGQCGQYVEVAGVKTYYEVHGEGEPLLLLHGGLATLESLYGLVPGLMKRYEVWLPERRGHGRTYDAHGPYSYQQFAEDTAAFMAAVGLERAHLVGWSDGGIMGLYLAKDHPELLERMVTIGAGFHVCGYTYEFFNEAKAYTPDNIDPLLADLLKETSPHGPEFFPEFLGKVQAMWLSQPTLLPGDLAAIATPTLAMLGEHDLVRREHGAEMAAALPQGQLAVVPGVSHYGPLERPELLLGIIYDFLAGGESTFAPSEGLS